MIGLTYAELKALRPCQDKQRAVARRLGGAKAWGARKITAVEAVAAGVTLGDLLWAASALSFQDADIERRIRLWMADCAARALPLYERKRPADHRVRDAIIAARLFARGEIVGAARDAARAAAWDAAGDAWAAARDAWAAAWAARAAARAAEAAAWAAEAAAGDASRAAAWAAAGDAALAAAWDAEAQWQLERLAAWLSDPEPDDWPLPIENAA